MAYIDNISNAYGSTPDGYYPGVSATQRHTASDPYSMRANPLAPVPPPASLPNTCYYNHGIGPNSGYGVDMAAIGGNAPAAGVAGIGVARTRSVRTTADAGGNMDMHTENLNIPNNVLAPPPMLTAPTPFNLVTSPFDSLEPASAVSVSEAYGGISMSMTASSIRTVTGIQGFSVFGDSPSNVGMSQSNASSSLFGRLKGWKGRCMCGFFLWYLMEAAMLYAFDDI
ncbi:hypothetical protein K435DRAFT_779476 [Dendrothele bispora CBS 962.96]|uniref:Uncharacterized protein n=1 Tax=Dendrothele bispora (strain CBS 962.96) TaxID=1314807 RepID=A0A4S8LYI8_DENBC|nr:hypothetical protein K435DRAFT_779476 [Dendrothele bispora CBS 962.96]